MYIDSGCLLISSIKFNGISICQLYMTVYACIAEYAIAIDNLPINCSILALLAGRLHD